LRFSAKSKVAAFQIPMKKLFSTIVLVSALVVTLTHSSLAQSPQGRLTLVNNTPVMTSDVVNATTVYYVPYQGNILATSNGTTVSPAYFFSPLTLTLESTVQTSGNIYDIFAFYTASTWYLCTGPAWNSSTSRGTGTGTTQLTQQTGVWLNTKAISNCYYSLSSVSVPALEGVYLGSIYMTGAGETSMQLQPAAAAGGPTNGAFLGVYNAYNRLPITAAAMDSTSSWTYGTSTERPADNSTSNRITFLDGLAQSNFTASYSVAMANSSTGNAIIGIGLDSTTSINVPWAQTGGTFLLNPTATIASYPLLGLHYVQAMEDVFAGTETFDAAGAYEALTLSISM
jgi:hypothetical protein